ncbi:unnamed protein product [Rotaria sordida]|uniref:Chitin-binding type-2 domain-containing protein n=1 Tax=Rotaria sordida TaxID=392033 RepID=A0A814PCZ3_9BILA|nr:unnamed protein product [Rotaria sordida]
MSYGSNRRLFYSLNIFIIIIIIIQVARTENFICEKDGFFPDKGDCWIYHICVGTTHSVKACKEDLLFNPIKNECDWAMNVNCNHTSYEDTLPARITTTTTTTTTITHVLYPSDYKLSSKNNSLHSSIFNYLCQSVDNDYVAHPTDCKQYAYCANGVPQTKLCKKGLFWSQAEKMCVWPAQSDCSVKNLTPAPSISLSTVRNVPWIRRDTTYPSSYILTDSPVSLPSSDIYKPSIICPPRQSWRVPDPYDCSIYHDCYHGNDLVLHCPAQLQYNPEKQTCDYIQNVQCNNKCTEKNEGARFIDSTSCCHYYECISGKLILQSCSHPNLFDIQIRKCLPYKKVKCDGRRQCLSKCHYLLNYDAGKNLCSFIPSCVGHSNGFYLDRTKPNCQSYIQCLDNRVVNHSRCSHGQRFNRNRGRCTSADQVPCLVKSEKVEFYFLRLLAVFFHCELC